MGANELWLRLELGLELGLPYATSEMKKGVCAVDACADVGSDCAAAAASSDAEEWNAVDEDADEEEDKVKEEADDEAAPNAKLAEAIGASEK